MHAPQLRVVLPIEAQEAGPVVAAAIEVLRLEPATTDHLAAAEVPTEALVVAVHQEVLAAIEVQVPPEGLLRELDLNLRPAEEETKSEIIINLFKNCN